MCPSDVCPRTTHPGWALREMGLLLLFESMVNLPRQVLSGCRECPRSWSLFSQKHMGNPTAVICGVITSRTRLRMAFCDKQQPESSCFGIVHARRVRPSRGAPRGVPGSWANVASDWPLQPGEAPLCVDRQDGWVAA